ncbi:hypothetical protein BIW11_11812 [Tropilaelaps mercedesae]|uniref:Uncharacterized protein n=1 Tax=Tropilaelaps mercedesae TaxID=418985 RepID=A0A1V9X9D2_9ACAR|nr:hypothetical protein BIW11_11812 [Tropilaelaps mercedesae]
MATDGFECIEQELVEYVRRYFKGALAKATEFAVKSSRSKYAADIKQFAAHHYAKCVQRAFQAIHDLLRTEGILEQMSKLREMAEQQKEFKDTPIRRPTGIASIDTQLLADVLNTGLLRKEREFLEELKQEQNRLVDELTNLSAN